MDGKRDISRESIIGLTVDQLGAATAVTKHRDGTTDKHPLETTKSHNDIHPQSWRHPKTGALTELPRFGLTRSEHIARSLRVEAALVKVLGGGKVDKALLEKHAHKALMEVIQAMGFEDRL